MTERPRSAAPEFDCWLDRFFADFYERRPALDLTAVDARTGAVLWQVPATIAPTDTPVVAPAAAPATQPTAVPPAPSGNSARDN